MNDFQSRLIISTSCENGGLEVVEEIYNSLLMLKVGTWDFKAGLERIGWKSCLITLETFPNP